MVEKAGQRMRNVEENQCGDGGWARGALASAEQNCDANENALAEAAKVKQARRALATAEQKRDGNKKALPRRGATFTRLSKSILLVSLLVAF